MAKPTFLTRSSSRALAFVSAWLVASAPLTAVAQPAPGASEAGKDAAADDVLYKCNRKAGGRTTISFKPETELKDLITWAMGFTCKNFIFEPRIVATGKKVTLISPNRMTPTEAYAVFLAALSTMGLTVVPKGNLLRIVETATAKGETLPLYYGKLPPNDDSVVRYIMRPRYMQLEALRGAMDSIRSQNGNVATVGASLVITDYASQVRDMVALQKAVDTPASTESIYTIPVVNSDAKNLAQQLNDILGIAAQSNGGGGAPGRGAAVPQSGARSERLNNDDVAAAVPSKILVDERTNTLLLVASEAGYMRVKSLVKRLDVAMLTEGAGSLHVYPLENGIAEDMANTLNSALQGQSNPRGTQPGQGGVAVQARSNSTNVLAGAELQGQVRVVGDKATNALLVTASGRDFYSLRDVIRRLDQPRRQVFIEAAVLEIQLSNENKIGTSSHGGLPEFGGLVLGGVQTGAISSLDPKSLASATGLIGGLIGNQLANAQTILGTTTSIPAYGILFQALTTAANANILSAPHFIAINNEKTEFVAGTNIPYQASTFGFPGGVGGATGSLGFGNNIQREPLTLKFQVTPRLSSGDTMRLEIEGEIKDQGETTSLGPTWTERKIKTQVVVRDQQTVVLGGLIGEKTLYSETKVPLLGDVPVLGYLFKARSKKKTRSNLMIVLTPYIVKDQLDLQEIRERKERERQEFSRLFDSLDDKYYKRQIDYRRKRGVVEEINRAILSVDEDAESLKALDRGKRMEDGVIDYKMEADEDDASGAGPANDKTPASDKPPTSDKAAPGDGKSGKPEKPEGGKAVPTGKAAPTSKTNEKSSAAPNSKPAGKLATDKATPTKAATSDNASTAAAAPAKAASANRTLATAAVGATRAPRPVAAGAR